MKKWLFKLVLMLCSVNLYSADYLSKQKLDDKYDYYCQSWSDVIDHMPDLDNLAYECSSVVEIGMRGIVSSWALLHGLSENPSTSRSYLGIDINYPSKETLDLAKALALGNDIHFDFWCINDMKINIPQTELLFIDSLHTYCHLTYELEKFAPSVSKYIALHDTSPPWGYQDDTEYRGDYSEYPSHIDRNKRGLWPAVEDFLKKHSEWELHERKYTSYGFTILKRVK